jgi:NAD-dependent deacetylase
MDHNNTIERAGAVLRGAKRIVALTGAGVSRPSGIPDFRSGAGIWQRYNPAEVASLSAFQRNPRRFFEWFAPLLDAVQSALPNAAHHALAGLERSGRLRAVITQNIDSLHRRAGSREVFELHGHIRTATCVECGHQIPGDPVIRLMRLGQVPRCRCGGLIKPDIVLFDELLPRGLYWLARRAGAKVIIVNQGETYFDAQADVVLREDVAEALPALAERAAGEPG